MSSTEIRNGNKAEKELTLPQCQYGADYFQQYRTSMGPRPYRNFDFENFFGSIAENILRMFHPNTVLDAGCAFGLLVEALWDRGVPAEGIDFSEYAVRNVRPDMAPHVRLGSITDAIPGRYDLVTCIEVVEHLPEDQAHRAIDVLTAITDTVLFSSTPGDFEDPTHVYVQPPLVWIDLFATRGFNVDTMADCSFLSPHAMVFRRSGKPLERETRRLYAQLVRHRLRASDRDTTRQLADQLPPLQSRISSLEEQLRSAAQASEEERSRTAELTARVLQLEREIEGERAGRHADVQAERDNGERQLEDAHTAHEAERLKYAELLKGRRDTIDRLENALASANTSLRDVLVATHMAAREVEQDIIVLRTSFFWRLKLKLHSTFRRR